MNITPRFPVCGPFKKAAVEDDLLVPQERVQLHAATDHRIVDGMHLYAFGRTLEHITTHPEQYLS